jgi:hypothetical protein
VGKQIPVGVDLVESRQPLVWIAGRGDGGNRVAFQPLQLCGPQRTALTKRGWEMSLGGDWLLRVGQVRDPRWRRG